MQASSVISLSPSFNSYSNCKLAEIAARVVEELGSDEFYDEFYFEREENPATAPTREERGSSTDYVEGERGNSVAPEKDVDKEEEEEEEDDDKEFEFAFVTTESELSSPISADEIFHNGQIRPVYPVFNRDLFLQRTESKHENGARNSASDEKRPAIRLPLRKLFIEERETTMTMRTMASSSSSDDELDGVPEDSYCVWRPKEAAAAEGRCKKSSSAGSNSKRWKFKDLLNRSHSDGSKDNFVFLGPSNSGRRKQSEERGKETPPVSGGKVKSAAAAPPPPAVFNRDGGEKRRSYLPYRQDLVGLFANVNGLSKNLQPF